MEDPIHQHDWDAGDLGCGDLVIRLRLLMRELPAGAIVRVHATDPGAVHDLPAWSRMTGEALVHRDEARQLYWFRRRGD